MSDMNSRNRFQSEENEEIKLYRRKRAAEFRLNIDDEPVVRKVEDEDVILSDAVSSSAEKSEDSNEITSFSNETTRAQIERELLL